MLDLQFIRTHTDEVVDHLARRHVVDAQGKISQVCLLDREYRGLKTMHDQYASKINMLSKAIGTMIKDQVDPATIQAAKDQVHTYNTKTEQLNQELQTCKEALLSALYELPNLAHPSVPSGKSMEDNVVVWQTESLPVAHAHHLPHWDIVKLYRLVDFELGNKITGAGFPLYVGYGAKLQRALIHFFLESAIQAGFVEVQPPILVNQASTYGTGQSPDKEGQMYYVPTDQLYLIPTAEVSITNIYRESLVSEGDLPIKHVGCTPCFRREAGSWGAQVRGLNRVHQFDKVELVEICHPDRSYQELEAMVKYASSLVEQLGLPYRILKLCTGDLGFCSAMTYDIEIFSVGQKQWLEVSSVSNFETFQAKRLNLRFKDTKKKSHLLHTLNGSGLALPRVLAALLEYYQRPNGIIIPEVLRDYMGIDLIKRP